MGGGARQKAFAEVTPLPSPQIWFITVRMHLSVGSPELPVCPKSNYDRWRTGRAGCRLAGRVAGLICPHAHKQKPSNPTT